jgi:hypothetical protein
MTPARNRNNQRQRDERKEGGVSNFSSIMPPPLISPREKRSGRPARAKRRRRGNVQASASGGSSGLLRACQDTLRGAARQTTRVRRRLGVSEEPKRPGSLRLGVGTDGDRGEECEGSSELHLG